MTSAPQIAVVARLTKLMARLSVLPAPVVRLSRIPLRGVVRLAMALQSITLKLTLAENAHSINPCLGMITNAFLANQGA